MKNIERIDKKIIDDVREYMGLERGDTSKDDQINAMYPSEIFEKWCERHGFINENFRKVIGNIYGVKLDNDIKNNDIKNSDRKYTLMVIDEIIKMIISEESISEYICDKLDISDDHLEEISKIVSMMMEEINNK